MWFWSLHLMPYWRLPLDRDMLASVKDCNTEKCKIWALWCIIEFWSSRASPSLAYKTATIMSFRSRKDSSYQPLRQTAKYNVKSTSCKLHLWSLKQPNTRSRMKAEQGQQGCVSLFNHAVSAYGSALHCLQLQPATSIFYAIPEESKSEGIKNWIDHYINVFDLQISTGLMHWQWPVHVKATHCTEASVAKINPGIILNLSPRRNHNTWTHSVLRYHTQPFPALSPLKSSSMWVYDTMRYLSVLRQNLEISQINVMWQCLVVCRICTYLYLFINFYMYLSFNFECICISISSESVKI